MQLEEQFDDEEELAKRLEQLSIKESIKKDIYQFMHPDEVPQEDANQEESKDERKDSSKSNNAVEAERAAMNSRKKYQEHMCVKYETMLNSCLI